MGHFLWVFWGMNIQNKESKLWLKLQPHPAEAQCAMVCSKDKALHLLVPGYLCNSLSHTHTQKGWVTIYFMKYLTHYLVKIQNWGQLLNFFFLSWKCTVISYWASFKKEEIKDKLSFPF